MKTKLFGAAALLLLISSGAAAMQVEPYEGVVIGGEIGTLACRSREDAVTLTGNSGTMAWFEEIQKSGRCVWWQDGDKIIISPRNYGEEIVAARQAASSSLEFLFVDRCSVKPPACADYFMEHRKPWLKRFLSVPADRVNRSTATCHGVACYESQQE
jgi:hypothetical protein